MTEKLSCQRCGKKLSKKTARQIDGAVVCSPGLFGQAPANARRR